VRDLDDHDFMYGNVDGLYIPPTVLERSLGGCIPGTMRVILDDFKINLR
jgi:hypothetical protein